MKSLNTILATAAAVVPMIATNVLAQDADVTPAVANDIPQTYTASVSADGLNASVEIVDSINACFNYAGKVAQGYAVVSGTAKEVKMACINNNEIVVTASCKPDANTKDAAYVLRCEDTTSSALRKSAPPVVWTEPKAAPAPAPSL